VILERKFTYLITNMKVCEVQSRPYLAPLNNSLLSTLALFPEMSTFDSFRAYL